MEQAVVTLVIAALSGLGVMNARLHNRIAENYVAKTDLSEAMDRFEAHMLRIENKLDKIIFK
jgi:hypothetical protein